MLIGYARASTVEQNLALQQAGCQKIISDTISGTRSERPGLTKLKEQLREGYTLVIWRLDRLGRSLKDLINWAQYLEANGIALKSLQEANDTSTPAGKLVAQLYNGKEHTLKQIQDLMNISKQTIYNIVEEETDHAAG